MFNQVEKARTAAYLVGLHCEREGKADVPWRLRRSSSAWGVEGSFACACTANVPGTGLVLSAPAFLIALTGKPSGAGRRVVS